MGRQYEWRGREFAPWPGLFWVVSSLPEMYRRDVAQCRVRSASVVEPLYEAEDFVPDHGHGRRSPAVEKVALERREEALAHRVVVYVADGAHRLHEVRLLAPRPEGERGVPGALFAVMDDRVLWLAGGSRHRRWLTGTSGHGSARRVLSRTGPSVRSASIPHGGRASSTSAARAVRVRRRCPGRGGRSCRRRRIGVPIDSAGRPVPVNSAVGGHPERTMASLHGADRVRERTGEMDLRGSRFGRASCLCVEGHARLVVCTDCRGREPTTLDLGSPGAAARWHPRPGSAGASLVILSIDRILGFVVEVHRVSDGAGGRPVGHERAHHLSFLGVRQRSARGRSGWSVNSP